MLSGGLDINSLTPAQGTGTNLLARHGVTLYGKGGEIINTYAPNDIYTDGGYSPLSDEDRTESILLWRVNSPEQIGKYVVFLEVATVEEVEEDC